MNKGADGFDAEMSSGTGPMPTLQDGPENLKQFLTYRVARTHARLNAQAQRLLDRVAGLTLTQWRILGLIGTAGTATSSELSRDNGLDKGLLSRRLKSMADQGLVTATADESDRRVQHLHLTPEGQSLFERTLPHAQARQQHIMRHFSEEEIVVFFDFLDRLERAAAEDSDL